MKIELKKISYNKRLSEETHAYSADLFVDGEKVAEVSNHGHGGCDVVHWTSKKVTEKQVSEWIAANHPPMFVHEGKPHPETLEGICCNLVNDWLVLKDWTRQLKTKIMAVTGTDVVSWNIKRLATAADVEKLKSNPKYANYTFLNGMTDEQLMAVEHSIRAEVKKTRGW